MLSPFDAIFDNFPYSTAQLFDNLSSFPYNILLNKETKDIVIQLALAGYKEEDIDISASGDHVNISLSKGDELQEGVEYIVRKIRSSAQKRSFLIPSEKYDLDNIEARLIDGILSIYIPAREVVKPRKIEIKGSKKLIGKGA